jgi:hypothetical protein
LEISCIWGPILGIKKQWRGKKFAPPSNPEVKDFRIKIFSVTMKDIHDGTIQHRGTFVFTCALYVTESKRNSIEERDKSMLRDGFTSSSGQHSLCFPLNYRLTT